MADMNKHHSNRTFRNRPACAGSVEAPAVNGSCSVCGRDDLSRTATGMVSTHIHADDLRAGAPVAPAASVDAHNAKVAAAAAAEAAAEAAAARLALAAAAKAVAVGCWRCPPCLFLLLLR